MEPQQFLARVESTELARLHALFVVGMVCLAEGKRIEAERYFRECTETGAYPSPEYWSAKAFLKFLQDDPKWPQWIESRAPISQ